MTARAPVDAASWRVRLGLTGVATAAVAAILVLGAVVLVWWVQHGLQTQLDAAVREQALGVAVSVADDPTSADLPVPPSFTGVGQVVSSDGAVLASSEQVQGEGALFGFAPQEASGSPTLRTTRVGPLDDAEYRVAVVQVPGSSGLRVYLGEPIAEIGRSVALLATSLALGIPVVLMLLALLTWWFAGRALRPVGELLERLDQSLVRQRRFVADAAHELRSPVAGIRAQIEAPPDPTRPHSAALRDEAERLSVLVDDLLALARLDSAPGRQVRDVDLDDFAGAAARSVRDRPGLTVDVSRVSAARLQGDPALLERAVRNLVDNAARHAVNQIELAVGSDGNEVWLSVADDGAGIPVEHRAMVLERFTRLDEARTRDAGGAGLGLAIVAEVTAAHGGRIEITDNNPGARVTIRLPSSGPG